MSHFIEKYFSGGYDIPIFIVSAYGPAYLQTIPWEEVLDSCYNRTAHLWKLTPFAFRNAMLGTTSDRNLADILKNQLFPIVGSKIKL
jgi:hypothetical protein